jgi:hypothetical protein
VPPWLSPVERLAVNQSVIGSNPIGGANFDLISQTEANLGFKLIASLPLKMGINGNHITEEVLQDFAMFCKVDLLRAPKTIKEHINNLKRYVKAMGSFIDTKKIRDFLFYIRSRYSNPRTYRSYLCTLKVFCRDFLKKGEWVESLRFPRIQPKIITDLPSKQYLRTFFNALPNDKAKTAFFGLVPEATGVSILFRGLFFLEGCLTRE